MRSHDDGIDFGPGTQGHISGSYITPDALAMGGTRLDVYPDMPFAPANPSFVIGGPGSRIDAPSVTFGIKADAGKLRMSLLPGLRALAPIARVMQWAIDVKGYIPGNWRQVEPQRYRDALARHFAAWLDDPRGRDGESPFTHLAHIGCCVLILLWHGDDDPDRVL